MLKQMNEMVLRRTKIVATLGPATDQNDVLEKVIAAGVDVVRLNFSHGSHEQHQARIEKVREIMRQQNRRVGILADLQGPKIRIAKFACGKVTLVNGDTFVLDAAMASDAGDQHAVGIDYKELPQDVRDGDTLLLNDGLIEMTVKQVEGSRIICQVVSGGELSNHKGINRCGGGLSAKALTDKDKSDLHFAMQQDVDYIALSFPRNATDIYEARELMAGYNSNTGVIAKIERTEAVENLDEIIVASDGVMVARGDLAVEIGNAEVPLVQKHIIQRARTLDKPVIIATQMMESMIENPVPTRAEVSDVATAVLENTDAIMLSAETAAGAFPVKAVQAMAKVCLVVEQQPGSQQSKHRVECRFKRVDEAIAMATMYTANHLNVQAVVALTESGATALWMSRIRTGMPIFGLSRFQKTLGKLTLYRGVYPIEFDITQCTRDDVNREAIAATQKIANLKQGDLVILTKGDLMGIGGGANAMKILKVGEVV